jgi:tRNA nucleotidyltransferase (CCA-adding enzyme)
MDTTEYLIQILKQESLTNESAEIKAIWKERENVERILLGQFNESKPTIRYGGSKAKGTMIRSNYDLDITCYFDRDDNKAGTTLEEIFNNVQKALETEYFVVRKTSALRLESKSASTKGIYFHIDVVPGRFIDEEKVSDDVFLHQTMGEKVRLKTNLQKHIDWSQRVSSSYAL